MLFYTHTFTPRLQYICKFIATELFGQPFVITGSVDEFKSSPQPKLNYSDTGITNEEVWIKPHGLLFERKISQQNISCYNYNGYKAFFKTEDDFGFDIFSAAFYLMSRYEEYLPHQKDEYGRYAHANSLAFRESFLHLPLVNIWIEQFKQKLKEKFPALQFQKRSFTFIPTYDIDEAFAYRHKGFVRTTGGLLKSIFTGNVQQAKRRLLTVTGKLQDEYDSFAEMDRIHEAYNLKPVYFFHVAQKNDRYDKNILPSKRAMQDVIIRHAEKYELGIHPSWQSGDEPGKLKTEILHLGHIAGRQIKSSRQHYIRFNMPATFRQLIDAGIEKDFSMGYGSINGFRASVASPFYWYDLEKEEKTNLLLFPFCFMDANSFFEEKKSAAEALEELLSYYDAVKKVSGTLITIWHNIFLGTAKRFEGWKEVYEQFLQKLST
ncbi:MAG: hypothetical protein C4308_02295 [Chitinophagaceae bacterium]